MYNACDDDHALPAIPFSLPLENDEKELGCQDNIILFQFIINIPNTTAANRSDPRSLFETYQDKIT